MSDQLFRVWQRGGNDTAIVFIHGFIGNYVDTWGAFPSLVMEDSSLNHCDVICWGYPSKLIRGFLRVPVVGRKLPTLPDVANALRTDLMLMAAETGDAYTDIVLVAHSMGGLVVQRLIVDDLKAPRPNEELLERLRCVLFYATPAGGVQVGRIGRRHPQVRALAAGGAFIVELQKDWIHRVYDARQLDKQEPGRLPIPVTVVAGLEDNVVPFDSVTSVYEHAETAPGSHVSVVKPKDRKHVSFQILKRDVAKYTCPELIRDADLLITTNCEIARRATDVIYATGSRSRDERYLREIERKLHDNPALVYIRVLMGPIRRQELRDHLLRVFKFRSPSDRSEGRQTLYVCLYEELGTQPEIFLCGNERRCLVVLPPLEGAGRYSTARLFTRREDVNSYRRLVNDLCSASTKLADAQAVAELPVDQIPG